MYQNDANKCLTGEVRLSYVHLDKPYANPNQPNAQPKYSCTILIPKSDLATSLRIVSETAALRSLSAVLSPGSILLSWSTEI